MSASAGRVLIIPKGDYNSATTYNMLDMVFYGGKSYICKQTSTGNAPTNTVYWQIMIDGASEFSALSDVELNNLQNGDGIYYDATAQKWKNTTPTSIAITTPPAKTEYSDGDILDLTGMVVTAYYVGGSTRNITSECTFSPANGTTLTTSDTSVTVSWREFTATQAISVVLLIYGVDWDGSSSPAMTRTDASADFVDPVPYVAGANDYSSPFDNIYPWSGMVRVTDSDAGELVAIPKFYYKLSQSTPNVGLKVQISKSQFEDSHVSPAHMDRGDGVGERDVIYVGRYHCGENNFKSITGRSPRINYTRSNFRTSIHNIGNTIWQWDFATRFTIWLLYLVEFANWDSQLKIGYGCGNNSGSQTMGASDTMPYHTGTMQSNRTSYGVGTQYRNIEGLWDNVYDWIDGCYCNSSGFNIILNPNNFSDSSGGVSVGTPSSGNPSKITVKNINNSFPLFIPNTSNGSDTTYLCDMWGFNSSYPLYRVGGSYQRALIGGMFSMGIQFASAEEPYIGSRLMKLPSA